MVTKLSGYDQISVICNGLLYIRPDFNRAVMEKNHLIELLLYRLTQPRYLILVMLILSGFYFFIDTASLLWLKQHAFGYYNELILRIITDSARGVYAISILAVFILFSWLCKKPQWFGICCFLLVAVLTADIFCDILKIVLGRARPYELFNHELYDFYFWQFKAQMWSFPSGHTTHAAALMVAMSLVWPRYCYGFCTVVVAVAVSRVLLLMHYPSDVIAAVYLGALNAYWIWLKFPPDYFATKLMHTLAKDQGKTRGSSLKH